MAIKSAKLLAFFTLLYVLLLHTSTLYLFTRGFLLTRLSLSDISSCRTCTLPPTHSRLVLLIIDALRFDFVSPEPALDPSPHYHHILTLPARLSAENPTNSILFNTFADPPTVTLQRIKGITTGSLPTFVDAGFNFGGSQIAEDSLLLQMQKAGKKVAFMGDDTWTTIYPTSFAPDMTFPFDSFNVEDLHSVDEGVITNMFPLLEKNSTASWDLLIGHFLGVDHVGHRLGPAHPTMTKKLDQMEDVLTRLVEILDDETLLVVMGDHGMNRKGDHGGDDDHETSAATWIYSKSKPLTSARSMLPEALAPYTIFPGAPVAHRMIQQIDILPSLSLLLGLPIPFNNLGTVIPELFDREGREGGALLEQALRLNANQVKSYLDAYRSSPSGGELDGVWPEIEPLWKAAQDAHGDQAVLELHTFTRFALASCRSLWAQFNVGLMYTGLFALALGSATVWVLYTCLERGVGFWKANGWAIMIRAGLASNVGAIAGGTMWVGIPWAARIFGPTEAILVGATLVSSTAVLVSTIPRLSLSLNNSKPSVLLILHSLAFLSNSFTFWEDRILIFLFVSSLVPFFLSAITNPQADARLRNRIFMFSALVAVCVRLAGISTVCREEQHPYCHVTFYASSTLPSPPLFVLLISVPASLILPTVVRRFMSISASDKGIAPELLEWGFRSLLLAGNTCWLLEWLESSDIIGHHWATALRAARTEVARVTVGLTLLGGLGVWWISPLCLEIRQSGKQDGKKEVQIIGLANSYGSSFVLFILIPFSFLFVVTQLTGQITLTLLFIALLALLEVIDSARDLQRPTLTSTSDKEKMTLTTTFGDGDGVPRISFSEIVPIALLALHAFHVTGHQATMSSIQWKSAFLLTPTLTYPISPLLVFVNSFGPQFLFAAAVPLLALWKVTPLTTAYVQAGDGKGQPQMILTSANSRVLVSSLRAALGMSFYFSILLLSSAASAAWLRRHLMVWKVFAPRFMAAGLAVVVIDLGVMLGITVGTGRVMQKVAELARVPG